MNVSARSYLTAGVAVLGAGAVALAPIQPLGSSPVSLPSTAISNMAVGLAAAVTPINPLQNIVDVIATSGANLGILLDDWANGLYVDGTIPSPPNTGIRSGVLPNNNEKNGNLGYRTGGYETGYLAALPVLQQVIRNLLNFEIGGFVNALRAPFEPGVNQPGKLDGTIGGGLGELTNFNQNVNGVPYVELPLLGELSQREIGALLPTLAGASYAALEPLINALTTPISGLLIGAIGPIVAPVLSVIDSVSNTVELLKESNYLGAAFELLNIPANAVGAFLNGGPTLDLTGLVSALGVTLPDTITSIGLKMGGLLSPGGVGLDALAAVADIGLTVDVPGIAVGPIGALVSLSNYMATAIVPPPTASAASAAVTEVTRPAPAPAAAGDIAETAVAEAEAEVTEVVAPQSVSAVDEVEAPAPAPKRERRGAAARSADSVSAAASDGDNTKPARAARRAG